MATTELSRLAWYKQASANLKSYLVELEASKAALTERDSHATSQMIVEVKRRLAQLDELLATTER